MYNDVLSLRRADFLQMEMHRILAEKVSPEKDERPLSYFRNVFSGGFTYKNPLLLDRYVRECPLIGGHPRREIRNALHAGVRGGHFKRLNTPLGSPQSYRVLSGPAILRRLLWFRRDCVRKFETLLPINLESEEILSILWGFCHKEPFDSKKAKAEAISFFKLGTLIGLFQREVMGLRLARGNTYVCLPLPSVLVGWWDPVPEWLVHENGLDRWCRRRPKLFSEWVDILTEVYGGNYR